MEEYPKLWWNSTYITWKAGFPYEEVSLAMTFISISCREFDSCQLVTDITDGTAIPYLASKVDDKDSDGDESIGDAEEDDDDDNDTKDEDNLGEDLHKTAMDIANKTDDSGFRSGTENNPKIEVLTGSGTTWTEQGAIILTEGTNDELLHLEQFTDGVP